MSLTSNVSAIYGAFSDIKDAIEDKGVTVAANTPVTGYAALIGDISGGGGGGYATEIVSLSVTTNDNHEDTLTPTDASASDTAKLNDLASQVVQKLVGLDSGLLYTESDLTDGYKRYTLYHSGASNKAYIETGASRAINYGFEQSGTYTQTGSYTIPSSFEFKMRYQSRSNEFICSFVGSFIFGNLKYLGDKKAWLLGISGSSWFRIVSDNADIVDVYKPYYPDFVSDTELWHVMPLEQFPFDNLYWYKSSGNIGSNMINKTLTDGTKKYAVLASGQKAMLFRSA